MAEFQEVMRQLGRICASNFGECDICDLHALCLSKASIDKYEKNVWVERLEKMIMSWAAEHPEPVYPSWYDYLHSIGVLYNKHTAGGDITEIHWGNMMTPIPANIAEKLGIEPEELP